MRHAADALRSDALRSDALRSEGLSSSAGDQFARIGFYVSQTGGDLPGNGASGIARRAGIKEDDRQFVTDTVWIKPDFDLVRVLVFGEIHVEHFDGNLFREPSGSARRCRAGR